MLEKLLRIVFLCTTHCGFNWVNIDSDNGLLFWRHQAITWTNTDLSSVRSLSIYMVAIPEGNTEYINQWNVF